MLALVLHRSCTFTALHDGSLYARALAGTPFHLLRLALACPWLGTGKMSIMRSKLTAILLGFGLVVATAAPSLACPLQDQASASTQQQTAQAQPQQSSQPSTQ